MGNTVTNDVQEELRLLTSGPSAPSADSSLYIIKKQTALAQGVRKSVLGVHLVIEQGNENGLFKYLNVERPFTTDPNKPVVEVREIEIVCDRLDINSPLYVPQCDVTIYAREVTFGPQGLLDTSAAPFATTKARDAEVTKAEGEDGKHGEPAGNVTLYTGRIDGVPGRKVIIAKGGAGQDAGFGKAGENGRVIPKFYDRTMPTMGYNDVGVFLGLVDVGQIKHRATPAPIKTPATYIHMTFEEVGPNIVVEEGTKTRPTNGTNAVRAGTPGEGGRGGVVHSNIGQLDAAVDNAGGPAGAAAPDTKGGAAGTPVTSCHYYIRVDSGTFSDDKIIKSEVKDVLTTQPGEDMSAPTAKRAYGDTPNYKFLDCKTAWLHPRQVQRVITFARDAYLGGDLVGVTTLLSTYAAAMAEGEPTATGVWSNRPAVAFSAASLEISGLLAKLAGNLDYYGNPAGYMPLLSLAGAMNYFDMQARTALGTLLLGSWVRDRELSTANAVTGITTAVGLANEATATAAKRIARAEGEIRVLASSLSGLSQRISSTVVDIDCLKTRLLQQAQGNADVKHKVKGLVKIAGAVCQVIPYAQPCLGGVGSLADAITDYDPDKTEGSAKKLKETIDAANKAIEEFSTKAAKSRKKLEKEMDAKKSKVGEFKPAEDDKTNPRANPLWKKPADAFSLKEKTEAAEREAQWGAVGANLGSAVSQTARGIALLKVPQAAVDAELAKLTAESADWKALAEKLKTLNDEKTAVFAKLTAILPTIAEGYAEISTNASAIRALQGEHAETVAALDTEAVLFIDRLDQKARHALQYALYLAAKAYETTLFRRTEVNWSLSEVTTAIATLLKPGSGWDFASISKAVDVLAPVFGGLRQSILDALIDDFKQTGVPTILHPEFGFSKTQRPWLLDQLVETGQVPLDPRALGLLSPGQERSRLRAVHLGSRNAKGEIVVRGIAFDPAGPPPPQSGNMVVSLRVAESGIMRSNNVLYRVHRDAPRRWQWTYHFSSGHEDASVPSPAGLDLLNMLVDDKKNEVKEKLASPVLWSDLTLEVDFSPPLPLEQRPRLERLLFTCEVEGVTAPEGFRVLEATADDAQAFFSCTPKDVNGFSDGRGRLYRIYPVGADVSLAVSTEAPLAFAGWSVAGSKGYSDKSPDKSIRLPMKQHLTATGHYQPVVGAKAETVVYVANGATIDTGRGAAATAEAPPAVAVAGAD